MKPDTDKLAHVIAYIDDLETNSYRSIAFSEHGETLLKAARAHLASMEATDADRLKALEAFERFMDEYSLFEIVKYGGPIISKKDIRDAQLEAASAVEELTKHKDVFRAALSTPVSGLPVLPEGWVYKSLDYDFLRDGAWFCGLFSPVNVMDKTKEYRAYGRGATIEEAARAAIAKINGGK